MTFFLGQRTSLTWKNSLWFFCEQWGKNGSAQQNTAKKKYDKKKKPENNKNKEKEKRCPIRITVMFGTKQPIWIVGNL